MTTPTPVQAPADLTEHLQTTPRSQAIDEHGFELNLAYWNDRMVHLPGAPVRGIGGDSERGPISRGSLFALADAACEDESNERIASVEQDVPGIGEALRRSAVASREDPETAFRTLQPFRPLIGSLGPKFFTKYLYFAGAGKPEHRCLIVDKRVLAT